MKARDFCYWLQGLFELSGVEELDKRQTEMIKKHLNMVFYHEIDPSMGGEEHQGKLSQIHQGDENLEDQAWKQKLTAKLPDYMNPDMTEEELDAKYGKGIRPRC